MTPIVEESFVTLPPSSLRRRDLVSPEQYGLPKASAAERLSPLDMNMPRLYGMRWILCFPLSPDTEKLKIYDDLKAGLAYTISKIPWICGNVGPQDESHPENNRIQVLDGLGGVNFTYHDLTTGTKDFPTYAQLKNEHFPLAALSTEQLSPLGVVPEGKHPVMAAQANFIEGGLLLTAGMHHSVSDGMGFKNILDFWADATSAISAQGSFNDIDPTSYDRSRLMTGLPGAKLRDFPEYVLAPTPQATAIDVNTHQMAATPMMMPPMTARIFRFSLSALTSIKLAASAHSTNDALMAFVWRHISIARTARDENHSKPNHSESIIPVAALLHAVSIRSRVVPPLSDFYLGNASVGVLTRRLPVSKLSSSVGLAAAASAIRSSMNAVIAPNRVLLTVGLITSRPDPTDYKFAYNGFLGPDLSCTTWADFGVYEMEWGSLGKPECFRVPGEGMDGSMIVLPRMSTGGLEVVVGLEDGAMGRLLEDKEFAEFAEVWA